MLSGHRRRIVRHARCARTQGRDGIKEDRPITGPRARDGRFNSTSPLPGFLNAAYQRSAVGEYSTRSLFRVWLTNVHSLVGIAVVIWLLSQLSFAIQQGKTTWRKTSLEKWGHIANIVSAIALTATAAFAVGAIWVANGQLQAMHEEQRAWVSIDAPPRLSAPLTYDVNGAQFTLLFTFNNYGHSPARNVSTFFEVFPGLGCHTDAECLIIKERVCQIAASGSSVALTVFPGEHPQSQEAQYVSNDAIAAATAKMPDTFKVIFPHIFLCIAYRVAGDDEIKKTWYALDVIRNQQNGVIRVTDGAIPVGELIVRLNPLAPMGAN